MPLLCRPDGARGRLAALDSGGAPRCFVHPSIRPKPFWFTGLASAARTPRARALPPPSPHLGHNTMVVGHCDTLQGAAFPPRPQFMRQTVTSTIHNKCLGVSGQPEKNYGKNLIRISWVKYFCSWSLLHQNTCATFKWVC